MDHPSLIRRVLFVLLCGAWLFLLLSLGSFHATDWPSHAVYPYPPMQNVMGGPGAFVAYYMYMTLGQGIFPVLFFSGVCVALTMYGNRVTDLWLRAIGLTLLAVAFAAVVHMVKPGTRAGLPEGNGGILGIGASSFLRGHCSAVLTSLILICTFLVGLLLCADDLVIRAPAMIRGTIQTVRNKAPGIKENIRQINWNIVPLPKLPSLPKFVTKDAAAQKAGASGPIERITTDDVGGFDSDEEDDAPRLLPRLEKPLPKGKKRPSVEDEIHLEYENDDPAPAAQDMAYRDEADPAPSVAATIPSPEESKVARPAMVVNAGNAANVAKNTPTVAGPRSVATMPVASVAEIEDRVTEVTQPTDEGDAENPGAGDAKSEIIVRLPNTIKPRQTAPPPPPPKELGEYNLPGWDELADAEQGYVASQEAYVREKAAILERSLQEFNIDAHVVEIDTGPVITMYEISLAPGIKVASITQLQNDIARALSAISVRIVAPVPGKNTVGIEVPNAQKEKVRFKELMQLAPDSARKMIIPLYLGKDASGEPLIADLAAMPHCLIAGTTGSGKSVCINTVIMSIMYTQRPDMVKLILIDPKVVEMAPFKDIPHLMAPVINDSARACSVLEWACEKMDERYELLAEAGCRNIRDYNKLTREELVEKFMPSTIEEEAKIPKFLPYWVIIIDELADLMMTGGKEVEASIVRLAQKARAVGIHLIVATQRPQATVVTGLIKANLPSKIAFRVNTRMDSRIILDQNGGELLLGYGDMLFLNPTVPKPIRAQGTFIDDKEIKNSVKLVRSLADAQYEPELMQVKAKFNSDDMKQDDMFDDAVKVVLETRRGSVSLLQRRLNIGYGRAAKLVEMMAQAGIVGDYKGTQSREATITLEEWENMKVNQQSDAENGMSV
ncbi:MAG: ftsK [Phycisphaerales bacterium]|nr:ftsK [Phycisphaerales bacterium]